jgi:Flp pilus assembly pilin Flp
MNKIKSFYRDDDGAVTVDWVVLTAAVVGLVVLIAAAMQDGALGLADGLASYMSNWTFS